jgi:hypothetical protein
VAQLLLLLVLLALLLLVLLVLLVAQLLLVLLMRPGWSTAPVGGGVPKSAASYEVHSPAHQEQHT